MSSNVEPSGEAGACGSRKHPQRKLADILISIAKDTSRERVSVGDILTAMDDRAFGALMLIFAMPNALPTPPGTSTILAAPLIFLAAQLTFARRPWLPRMIADRSMLRDDFAGMIGKAAPWISWAERLLKPRIEVLARPPAEYAIGAVCLVLALILFLPIPLGNMLPALAICMFSLGLLERDGVWIISGFVTAIVSVVIVYGVVYALFKGAIFLIRTSLG
ncbi:MAG: exopolysaccharide biosynthesis protein [Rhizobiaceae bacterium]|nr:exopolysaccharide biosynthesis protein [Rhizobiaceae bacterium]